MRLISIRQRYAALVAVLVPLLLFVLFASVVPTQAGTSSPDVCNPCDCENDNRENCQGIEFYALYARESGSQCTMELYRFNGQGVGYRVMRVRERDVASLPEFPTTNTLVRQNEGVALYKLTSGEFQINAGPDENSKVYVIVFNWTCPADVVREETFILGQE